MCKVNTYKEIIKILLEESKVEECLEDIENLKDSSMRDWEMLSILERRVLNIQKAYEEMVRLHTYSLENIEYWLGILSEGVLPNGRAFYRNEECKGYVESRVCEGGKFENRYIPAMNLSRFLLEVLEKECFGEITLDFVTAGCLARMSGSWNEVESKMIDTLRNILTKAEESKAEGVASWRECLRQSERVRKSILEDEGGRIVKRGVEMLDTLSPTRDREIKQIVETVHRGLEKNNITLENFKTLRDTLDIEESVWGEILVGVECYEVLRYRDNIEWVCSRIYSQDGNFCKALAVVLFLTEITRIGGQYKDYAKEYRGIVGDK